MKKILTVLLTLACVSILTSCLGNSIKKEDAEPIVWSNLELGSHLPVFENAHGKIGVDRADTLTLNIAIASKEEFKNYCDLCKNAGYTIDSENTDNVYDAFNSDGYHIRILYSSYGDVTLDITLYAPEEMKIIEWPQTGLGSMLPATESDMGDISWNNSETFIIHVGDTTIEECNAYISKCEDAGFVVDYRKDDGYYSAKNEDGYELTIRYLGFYTIEVSLKSPKDNHVETKEPEQTEKGDLSADFKTAMDSYEAFMDEYVAFMKRYKENPADLTLIADYADYLTKYAKWVNDFSAWEGEDLTTAELAYYAEVQARVTKKLLEIA